MTEGIGFDSHYGALEWLRAHGFPVHPDVKLIHGEDAVVKQCQSWEERRGNLEFEIDGAVVKVNDFELQRRLGVVGREPRWAIAWKFPPTTAVTKLNDIGWNPGKFGDLHPYAMLEPVHVSGVTVKMATLHNEEDLARKDLRVGEEVIVLRAGDVIPQVLSPAPHVAERKDRPEPPHPPARCPVCGTPTIKDPEAVFTKCPNRDCPGRRWQLLTSFAGVMDIDGLGEKLVTLFMDLGWVKTAADFYRLTAEQIAEQPGFGQVSAQKLVNAIEASKQQPFGRVLFAIGIEEIGYVTGRNIAQHFRNVETLLAATPEQIEEVQGVGPKMAQKIHDQLADPSMRALIEDLKGVGAAVRGSRAAARRRSARRQHVRAHGHAAQPDPRAGHGENRRRRRPRHRVGLEEDGVPRGRRERRIEAGERRASRSAGARRGRTTGAARWWRFEPLAPRTEMRGGSCGTVTSTSTVNRSRPRSPKRPSGG